MTEVMDAIAGELTKYSLITAFALIGITVWFSYVVSDRLTRGRVHGSAIAILIGLVLAYVGGYLTEGKKGIADVAIFSGIGLMGGAMFRDLAIVATAFGVRLEEFLKTGISGVVSLFAGVVLSFIVGGCVAYAFGYQDAVSMTTIGAGAATYHCGSRNRWRNWSNRRSYGDQHRRRAGQVNPGHDDDTAGCALDRSRQSAFRTHLWRTDGHNQRSRSRTRRDRPQAGALRCDDGNFLYRPRLFARPVSYLHDHAGNCMSEMSCRTG